MGIDRAMLGIVTAWYVEGFSRMAQVTKVGPRACVDKSSDYYMLLACQGATQGGPGCCGGVDDTTTRSRSRPR